MLCVLIHRCRIDEKKVHFVLHMLLPCSNRGIDLDLYFYTFTIHFNLPIHGFTKSLDISSVTKDHLTLSKGTQCPRRKCVAQNTNDIRARTAMRLNVCSLLTDQYLTTPHLKVHKSLHTRTQRSSTRPTVAQMQLTSTAYHEYESVLPVALPGQTAHCTTYPTATEA